MSSVSELEELIKDRIRRIEAASKDLVFNFSVNHLVTTIQSSEPISSQLVFDIISNRTVNYLTQIYSLRDYLKKLATAKGMDEKIVYDFVKTSQAITLCGHVKNSDVHGPDYRKVDISMEYRVKIYEQAGAEPKPTDRVIGEELLLFDGVDLYQASTVAQEAMVDWKQFIEDSLGIELLEHRPLTPGHSVYRSPIPSGLLEYTRNKRSNKNL